MITGNGNKGAFPRPHMQFGSGVDFSEFTEIDGLSIRQHFASIAPDNIPDFFTHVEPVKDFEVIDWSELTGEDEATCRSWQMDKEWDLPDHLQWFQQAHNRIYEQKIEWQKLNQKERYFQWRTYYADMLIKQLNKDAQK